MPQTTQDRTQAALAAIPAQESLVGIFVSQTGAIATVDQGNSRLQVKAATQTPVLPGDPVRLERRDGQLIMIGPSAPRAVLGRVTVAGSPARVEYPNGSGITALLPVNPLVTVAVNDIVLIEWGSGGTVVCKVVGPNTPTPPLPPAGGGSPPITQKFIPLDSGSYQGSNWWTNEVYASANNVGAWFYGSMIRDTIPDTATILSARIFLPLRQYGFGSPILGRHSSESKPSGPVIFGASAALEPRNDWVNIPLAYIDHLKSNAGGLGMNHGVGGGHTIFRGTQGDGDSGALTVTYNT